MLGQMLPEITLSMVGLTFVEGLMAFVSPCILPLLPVYLLYLTGNESEPGKFKLLRSTLGFVLGFTIVFGILGATASGLGGILSAYRFWLQKAAGAVVVLFGLNYLGLFGVSFLNRSRGFSRSARPVNFGASILFGAAFAFSWTPCLTAFLGTALLFAANLATMYQGMGLLLVFSLGLAIPFILTALLWDHLKGAVDWIKNHYRIIQSISGGLLIAVGLWMLIF